MASNEGLTMELSVAVNDNSLEIEYWLHNASGASFGVYDRIMSIGIDDSPRFLPENVYVDFEDPVLHLRKMAIPIPEGLAMSEVVPPLVSILDKGAEVHEKFTLPVPVAVCNPYKRAMLAGAAPDAAIIANKPASASSIQLSLGVFNAHEIQNVHLLPFSPAYPTVFRVWPPGPPIDHQIILAKKIDLHTPIAVGDYAAIV